MKRTIWKREICKILKVQSPKHMENEEDEDSISSNYYDKSGINWYNENRSAIFTTWELLSNFIKDLSKFLI